MRMKPLVSIRWVLVVVLLPLVVLGLYVLGVQIHGLLRYDQDYFTETYSERYDAPGAVARALEGALQANDQGLLAELQGLRQPVAFDTDPNLIFVMLWERGDRYISYMYFDMQSFLRHMHYVEQVKGRWVVTPPDLYYYMHSGRWVGVFVPVAILWWLIGAVGTLAVLVHRLSARLRAQMYGEEVEK